MKSTYKARLSVIALACSIALAGCGPAPSSNYASGPVTSGIDQITRTDNNEVRLLREFQKIDPKITDVMSTIKDNQETIQITRTNDDGTLTSWTMPPSDFHDLKQKAGVTGNTSDTDWMGYAMATAGGALLGGVVANMMNSSANKQQFSSNSQYRSYRGISTSQRNGYFARREEEERRAYAGHNPASQQMLNQAATVRPSNVPSGKLPMASPSPTRATTPIAPAVPKAPVYASPSYSTPSYSAPARSYSAPAPARSSSFSGARASVSVSS